MLRDRNGLAQSEAVEPPQIAWADQEDTALVQGCLDGNEVAWDALIERYNRLIYSIPLRYGVSQSLADEIFQETCLIMLEKLGTLRDQARVGSWIITTTRRLCMQHWRQNKRLKTSPIEDDMDFDSGEEAVETSMLQLEQQHLIYQALVNIPSRDQTLLRALYFDVPPRPYAEIAVALNVPLGSIGPLRARGLQKLRREMMRLESLMA
ncbi:MAG: RNA polymerase sigma factor [Candidatus Promineifilaceae bacterium]